MLDLLYGLKFGIDTKEISKKQHHLIDKLLKLQVIKLQNNKYSFRSDYVFGTIDISANATGYLNLFDSNKKDLLIEKYHLLDAQKGDIVIAKKDYKNSNRPKAKVILVVQKEFNTSIAYLNNHNAFDFKTEAVKFINASRASLRQLPNNTLLKIDNYTNDVIEVLGVLDDPSIDDKLSMALYDREFEFSEESYKQAKAYGKDIDKNMYLDRVDLTHLDFCTIDPQDAKDFDDAIYYDKKTNKLFVAIADVSHYVTPFTSIDQEAKNRGFSIYFPHKSVPMLPENLSQNICSLVPNKDRLAFVVEMVLDDNGVKSSNMYEAIIKSKRKYTYDTIDNYLSHKTNRYDITDIKIFKWLLALYKKTQNITIQRLKNGFDFQNNDVTMILKDNIPQSSKISQSTPSHKLVQECMLLANVQASKIFKKGIFRIHSKPNLEKIKELLSALSSLGIEVSNIDNIHSSIQEIQAQSEKIGLKQQIDKLIIKSQQKAKYAVDTASHFGLGFESYTHFTSPIRRYSDLLVHRLIKAIISNDNKKKNFILNSITNTIPLINQNEKITNKIVWDFIDRKLSRWASLHIGETYDGIIVDTSGNMMIAKMDAGDIKDIRVFVYRHNLHLFQEVKLKIISCDIKTAKIITQVQSKLETQTA